MERQSNFDIEIKGKEIDCLFWNWTSIKGFTCLCMTDGQYDDVRQELEQELDEACAIAALCFIYALMDNIVIAGMLRGGNRRGGPFQHHSARPLFVFFLYLYSSFFETNRERKRDLARRVQGFTYRGQLFIRSCGIRNQKDPPPSN